MSEGESRVGANPNFALFLYFLLKTFPYAVSAVLLYLGYDLYLRGVTGQASLATDATTVQDQLINAAPGLIFGVGGLVSLVVSIAKGAEDSSGFGDRYR